MFIHTGAYGSDNSSFGQGQRIVADGDFLCSDTEMSLFECTRRGNYPYTHPECYGYCGNEDCTHTFCGSAVGVVCQGDTSMPIQCENGDVRLLNRSANNEGRLEMCAFGYWASVGACDDGFRESHLACRHLGLPADGELVIITIMQMMY